jgi:hypothetical protein
MHDDRFRTVKAAFEAVREWSSQRTRETFAHSATELRKPLSASSRKRFSRWSPNERVSRVSTADSMKTKRWALNRVLSNSMGRLAPMSDFLAPSTCAICNKRS